MKPLNFWLLSALGLASLATSQETTGIIDDIAFSKPIGDDKFPNFDEMHESVPGHPFETMIDGPPVSYDPAELPNLLKRQGKPPKWNPKVPKISENGPLEMPDASPPSSPESPAEGAGDYFFKNGNNPFYKQGSNSFYKQGSNLNLHDTGGQAHHDFESPVEEKPNPIERPPPIEEEPASPVEEPASPPPEPASPVEEPVTPPEAAPHVAEAAEAAPEAIEAAEAIPEALEAAEAVEAAAPAAEHISWAEPIAVRGGFGGGYSLSNIIGSEAAASFETVFGVEAAAGPVEGAIAGGEAVAAAEAGAVAAEAAAVAEAGAVAAEVAAAAEIAAVATEVSLALTATSFLGVGIGALVGIAMLIYEAVEEKKYRKLLHKHCIVASGDGTPENGCPYGYWGKKCKHEMHNCPGFDSTMRLLNLVEKQENPKDWAHKHCMIFSPDFKNEDGTPGNGAGCDGLHWGKKCKHELLNCPWSVEKLDQFFPRGIEAAKKPKKKEKIPTILIVEGKYAPLVPNLSVETDATYDETHAIFRYGHGKLVEGEVHNFASISHPNGAMMGNFTLKMKDHPVNGIWFSLHPYGSQETHAAFDKLYDTIDEKKKLTPKEWQKLFAGFLNAR